DVLRLAAWAGNLEGVPSEGTSKKKKRSRLKIGMPCLRLCGYVDQFGLFRDARLRAAGGPDRAHDAAARQLGGRNRETWPAAGKSKEARHHQAAPALRARRLARSRPATITSAGTTAIADRQGSRRRGCAATSREKEDARRQAGKTGHAARRNG